MYINIEQKSYVLRKRLNVSTDNVGSLRYSGRLFHTIGPDAVKECRPYVDSSKINLQINHKSVDKSTMTA